MLLPEVEADERARGTVQKCKREARGERDYSFLKKKCKERWLSGQKYVDSQTFRLSSGFLPDVGIRLQGFAPMPPQDVTFFSSLVQIGGTQLSKLSLYMIEFNF